MSFLWEKTGGKSDLSALWDEEQGGQSFLFPLRVCFQGERYKTTIKLKAVKVEHEKNILLKTEDNEIRFNQIGEQLLPYQLSAGEKQILAILLTVLVEDNQSYFLTKNMSC